MKWPTVKLKDIALIQMGQSPPGHTYNDKSDGLPFFQGKTDFGPKYPTVRMWCNKPNRIADKGDVLLSVRAPVGPTNLADMECCIGRGLAAIRSLDGDVILPDFVHYFFKWIEPNLSRTGHGSTFAAIKRKEVENIHFPLPPSSEQRRIVRILDQADSLRRLRAEADAKAESILPALFYKLFGDPAKWSKITNSEPLKNLIEIKGGATPSKSNKSFWDGDIPWISPKSMKQDFIIDAVDHITKEALKRSPLQMIRLNSVLIVVRGMILARCVPIAIARKPITINQDMKALYVLDERISPEFLFAALRYGNHLLMSKVGTAAHGTRKLDTDRLLSMPILIPDEANHIKFKAAFNYNSNVVENQRKAQPLLETLFKTLLFRAFSGDLTAKWREGHMKELLAEMGIQAQLLGINDKEV